jgi:uncharacterized protein YodC (DUF2158 family)
VRALDIGDVVRLKSGHWPRMTISRIDHDQAHCRWFAGTTLCHGSFRLADLVLAKVRA